MPCEAGVVICEAVDVIYKRFEVGVSTVFARYTACLLECHEIPCIAAYCRTQAYVVCLDNVTVKPYAAETVGRGVCIGIEHVAVDGTSADIEVADYDFFAGGLAYIMEICVEGIFRETVADGKDSHNIVVCGDGCIACIVVFLCAGCRLLPTSSRCI